MIPHSKNEITADDEVAVLEVLRRGVVTRDYQMLELQDALCRMMNVRFALAFSSGTAALHAAIEASGVNKVITPTLTFAAVFNAARLAQDDVELIDVDPHTLVSLVPQQDTWAAFVPMDYAGYPFSNPAPTEYRITIRDACHSLPSWIGHSPLEGGIDMAVFSFHPAKHVAGGEGGAVVTDNKDFYDALLSIRNNGRDRSGEYYRIGNNYFMDEMSCALALSQLRRVRENYNKIVKQVGRYYDELEGLPFTLPPDHLRHGWHLFVIRLHDYLKRDSFRAASAERSVGTQVHYKPLDFQPYVRKTIDLGDREFPSSTAAFHSMVSIPLFASMTHDQQDHVIKSIKEVVKELGL